MISRSNNPLGQGKRWTSKQTTHKCRPASENIYLEPFQEKKIMLINGWR